MRCGNRSRSPTPNPPVCIRFDFKDPLINSLPQQHISAEDAANETAECRNTHHETNILPLPDQSQYTRVTNFDEIAKEFIPSIWQKQFAEKLRKKRKEILDIYARYRLRAHKAKHKLRRISLRDLLLKRKPHRLRFNLSKKSSVNSISHSVTSQCVMPTHSSCITGDLYSNQEPPNHLISDDHLTPFIVKVDLYTNSGELTIPATGKPEPLLNGRDIVYTKSSKSSTSENHRITTNVPNHGLVLKNMTNLVHMEHNYAGEGEIEDMCKLDGFQKLTVTVQSFNRPKEPKSLHRSLTNSPRRKQWQVFSNSKSGQLSHSSFNVTCEVSALPCGNEEIYHNSFNGVSKRSSGCGVRRYNMSPIPIKHSSVDSDHFITINRDGGIHGDVKKCIYFDHNLVVVQDVLVSFWTQSALGNILGAQNMWIPNGSTDRLIFNNKYCEIHSLDAVIGMEQEVAYAELWTNEHKSDKREGPLADVFAAVYYRRHRQQGIDKKVLQLENIKSFSRDVQFVVMKHCAKFIVTWYYTSSLDPRARKTYIHSYQLAADYQTIALVQQIQSAQHYVSSLRIIEECENLIAGCGDNKLTLWNVDVGYIVATIDLSQISSRLDLMWAICDRGFLFTVYECSNSELCLIAIHGVSHSWKKLQTFVHPSGFKRLRGVSMENGLLIAYYEEGIACWKGDSGDVLIEECVCDDIKYFPCGRFTAMLCNNVVALQHSLSRFLLAKENA